MKLIAKAALGALALASLATAAVTPANANHMSLEIGPRGVIVQPRDPCLRAPEFRPGYCFQRDSRNGYWNRYAYNNTNRDWRYRERIRREAERRAEEQRGYGYGYDTYNR